MQKLFGLLGLILAIWAVVTYDIEANALRNIMLFGVGTGILLHQTANLMRDSRRDPSIGAIFCLLELAAFIFVVTFLSPTIGPPYIECLVGRALLGLVGAIVTIRIGHRFLPKIRTVKPGSTNS